MNEKIRIVDTAFYVRGDHTQVESDNIPQNETLKILPAFPRTHRRIQTTFEIGNKRFDSRTPFLEHRLHLLAAGDVLHRPFDFVEHNIDNASTLRITKI